MFETVFHSQGHKSEECSGQILILHFTSTAPLIFLTSFKFFNNILKSANFQDTWSRSSRVFETPYSNNF